MPGQPHLYLAAGRHGYIVRVLRAAVLNASVGLSRVRGTRRRSSCRYGCPMYSNMSLLAIGDS